MAQHSQSSKAARPCCAWTSEISQHAPVCRRISPNCLEQAHSNKPGIDHGLSFSLSLFLMGVKARNWMYSHSSPSSIL